MKRVDAGIVLYNPDIKRLKSNINAVEKQVKNIILFDNGSRNITEIKKVIANHPKAVILQSKANIGIASALNKIFNYGYRRLHSDYILTIDQDSICSPNLVSEYFSYFNSRIGIYTPVVKDINANKENGTKITKGTQEVRKCITSGSLTCCKAWLDVNGFDESMFIDCVDFDFCNRIKNKGYKILRVNSTYILHELGHINVHNSLFGKVFVKNHNSFRKYYIARNTIYVARKSNHFSKVILAILQVMKQMLLVLNFEDNKLEKEKALLNGAVKGIHAYIPNKWN